MSVCVAAFPLYRRRVLVEEVSQCLALHQKEEATTYWRGKAKELMCQLTNTGVSLEAAQHEVRQLLYTALEELQRQDLRA